MAPLTPHWTQPSHPDIQEVVQASATEFLTKSLSKVALPPFAVYAKMSFPPCDVADEPTYATVQCGKDRHLNLNSDLLYINHSCEPSLIFDTANFNVLAGPKGLQPGDELTFFYPSTEWHMAQPFDCFCGAPSCRGRIAGARDMPRSQLEGLWLNGHIRELLDERDARDAGPGRSGNDDPTAQALRDALKAAERVVEAARSALRSYTESSASSEQQQQMTKNGVNGSGSSGKANGGSHEQQQQQQQAGVVGGPGGGGRNGASARELGGEMGGDTTRAA